jgi:hypothetical protein
MEDGLDSTVSQIDPPEVIEEEVLTPAEEALVDEEDSTADSFAPVIADDPIEEAEDIPFENEEELLDEILEEPCEEGFSLNSETSLCEAIEQQEVECEPGQQVDIELKICRDFVPEACAEGHERDAEGNCVMTSPDECEEGETLHAGSEICEPMSQEELCLA